GESSHAALAEHHVVIALRHDVLGGEQELVERRGHTALEQHRFARAAGSLEEREVLHVARADLDAVGVLINERERLMIDRFGDDRQVELLANARENLESFFLQSLKRIRRRARLVRAAAEKLPAAALDALGDRAGLIVSLDGAWTTDDD